jgi:hypothetical protein
MCRSGDILGPRWQAHIFPTKALLATTSFSKACYMKELTCNRRAYEISGLLDIPGVAWLEISLIVSVINLVYKNYRYCKLIPLKQ